MKNPILVFIVFILTFMLTYFVLSSFIPLLPPAQEPGINQPSGADGSGFSMSESSASGILPENPGNTSAENISISGRFETTTAPEFMSVYNLDPFFPADSKGNIGVRNTGTYTFSDDRETVYAVRSVSGLDVIPLSLGTSLEFFGSTDYSDIVFIQSEKLIAETSSGELPTISAFNDIASNPVFVSVPYEITKNNSGRWIELEDNFTGIICYTFETKVGNTIGIEDGSEAVRIILPEGIQTGNIFFGKPTPKPDKNVMQADNTTLLQWNDETAVSVKYYESYAPKAMGIIAGVLGLLILIILVYRSLQIFGIRMFIKYVDNGETGFRKKNN